MESALLGIVLDSSILIAAERRKLTTEQAIETVQQTVGEVPIALCSVTVAEIGHGIYRADTHETRSRRRKFLDELKATVPIYPVTDITAEIVAQIGGEQAAKGINLSRACNSTARNGCDVAHCEESTCTAGTGILHLRFGNGNEYTVPAFYSVRKS